MQNKYEQNKIWCNTSNNLCIIYLADLLGKIRQSTFVARV